MKRKTNKKPNRILWAVLAPIFAAIVGFGAWWAVSNWATIAALFTGTQIYTHEQVQDAYNQGYLAGNEAEEEYSDSIVEYQNTIDGLQVQKTELTAQVAAVEAQIAALEFAASENQALIDSLQADLAELTTQNQTLQTELQNTIAYYEQLLQAYQDVDKYIVAFKVDGEQYAIRLVTGGEAIGELPAVENTTDYVFNYWEIDGQQITANTVISTHTIVEANITAAFTLDFIIDGQIFESQKVLINEFATAPTAPETDTTLFNGWYDGEILFDFSNPITSNYTLTANYSQGMTFYVSGLDATNTFLTASQSTEFEFIRFVGTSYFGYVINLNETYLSTNLTVLSKVILGQNAGINLSSSYKVTFMDDVVLDRNSLGINATHGNIEFNGNLIIDSYSSVSLGFTGQTTNFNGRVYVHQNASLYIRQGQTTTYNFNENIYLSNGSSLTLSARNITFNKTIFAYEASLITVVYPSSTYPPTYIGGIEYGYQGE